MTVVILDEYGFELGRRFFDTYEEYAKWLQSKEYAELIRQGLQVKAKKYKQ